jgi:hypothetical protein
MPPVVERRVLAVEFDDEQAAAGTLPSRSRP